MASSTRAATPPASLPRVALAKDQFRAVLVKNVLLKRRAWRTSICELLSPGIMLGLLVIGYTLATFDPKAQGIYASPEIELDPLIKALAPLVSGRPLDLSVGCTLGGIAPSGGLTGALTAGSSTAESDAEGDASDCAGGQRLDLRSLRKSFNDIVDGPLPVIPFDLFVGAGRGLQSQLGASSFEQLVALDEYTRQFGNLLTLGTLHISPDTQPVRDFVAATRRRHPLFDNRTVRVHSSEAAALRHMDVAAGEINWGLIHFTRLEPRHVDFAIRLNYSTVPRTTRITRWIARGFSRTYQQYIFSGFLTLQQLVDEYAFELAAAEGGARPYAPPSSYAVAAPMPTAAYSQNLFYMAVSYMLSLVLTLCMLFPVALLTKAVVVEKELRLKQTMRIMGLRDKVLYASWYTTALFQFVLITVLASLVVKLFVVSTPLWVVGIYIGSFCLGAIGFAFLISVFFSNAVLASVVGPVAFFGGLLPRYLFFSTNRYEKINEKIGWSLLLPTAFAFGADIIADYELNEVGVSPQNWDDADYSFSTSVTMMLVDALLYTLLALYLERVLPSRYGSRDHPLFFLLPSWWARSSPRDVHVRASLPTSASFEPAAKGVAGGDSVEIVRLVKTYGSGRVAKTAVDGLSVSFYSGQISCLLGHNGAGKTTTLSVLTGLYSPTKGDCYVFGYSVSKARRAVYRLLGICPQHDVLWPTLTVAEHLAFFATLKGVLPYLRERSVTQMMQDVGLPEKAHTRAAALSGGMKRKLSVGCALIGGSRAVLLDEPSSGMDPASRRSMWDMLRRAKPERVLVLTTHYMDEADLLADRISVMSQGTLRCAGSSLFLKSRFGLGYTLSMIIVDGRASPSVTANLTAALRQYVPEGELLSEAGDELSFRLPIDAAGSFGALFAHLERHKAELGVGGFGISITSMEEVFLHLAQGDDALPAAGHGDGGASPRRVSSPRAVAPAPDIPDSRPATPSRIELELQPSRSESDPPAANGRARVGIAPPAEIMAPQPLARPPPADVEMHVVEDQMQAEAAGAARRPAGAFAPPARAGGDGGAGGGGGIGGGIGGGATRSTAPSTGKQLRVMLGKRWTCVKRDPKTFLTQQLLPTSLVALILLILTIEDWTMGPPLSMSASIYRRQRWGAATVEPATQFVVNAPATNEVLRELDASSVTLSPRLDVPDSLNLSHFLLDTYNDHARETRMAAAALRDTIHVRLRTATSGASASILPSASDALGGALVGCATKLLSRANLNATSALGGASALVSTLNASAAVGTARGVIGGIDSSAIAQQVTGALMPAGDADTRAAVALTIEPFVEVALRAALSAADAVPSTTDLDSVLRDGVASVGAGNTALLPVISSAVSVDSICDALAAALPAPLLPGGGVGGGLGLGGIGLGNGAGGMGGNGSLASASLGGAILGMRVDGEPAALWAAGVALDAAARSAIGGMAQVLPIDISPVTDALPVVPEWAATIIGLTEGGIAAQLAEALLTPEQQQQLALFRQYAAVSSDLNAFQSGTGVRLPFLEGRPIRLADLIGGAAAVTNASAVAAPLADLAARGAPISLGALSVLNVTLTIGEVRVSNSGIDLRNVVATASAVPAAPAAPPVPIEIEATIGRLELSDTRLSITALSYSYGDEAGTSDGLTVTASSPTPLQAKPDIDLELPVPLTLLHNSSSYHAYPAFLGEATSAAWREAHAGSAATRAGAPPAYYRLYNDPLPKTAQQSLRRRLILSLLCSIFMLIPLCYIPASAAVFVVRERVTKSKHLQLVSGATARLYWLSTYLFDMGVYSVLVCIMMIIFVGFDEPSFVGSAEQALASWAVLMLYGLAVFPLTYCYSFAFDSPTTAQISIIILNILAAFGMTIAHQIMATLPTTQDADAVLVWVWRLMPGYNLGEGIIELTANYYENDLIGLDASPLDAVGRPLLLLFIEAVAFSALLMRLEHSQETRARAEPCLRWLCGVPEPSLALSRRTAIGLPIGCLLGLYCLGSGAGSGSLGVALVGLLLLLGSLGAALAWERRLRRRGGTADDLAAAALAAAEGAGWREEADVAAERARVETLLRGGGGGGGGGGGDDCAVLISGLHKVYPARGRAEPKVAVVDLSLGIPRAECFGFLGVNGAGKTTTLSILTGDYLPTSGRALIDGHDVVAQRDAVRERVGYCPQANPLIELMTARETLVMFARLKNIPERRIPPLVDSLLKKVTLTPYADRVCGSYSGGNKRKLSLAIALVGSPAVVFLDEPSSGMDPVSRRRMWDIITKERRERSIILTTHSMEECEALCTRIGIMTAGRLQCLGGQQHLKSKYGGGYTLELRCDPGHADAVRATVPELFPGARLESVHAERFKYELPMESLTLSAVFEQMEARKEELGVLDYSASQPSLESIFLTIAKDDINRRPTKAAASTAGADAAAEQQQQQQSL